MPHIALIQKDNDYKYPATITEAVVDLSRQKKLSKVIDELSQKGFQGLINQDLSNLTNYKKGQYWIVSTEGQYVGQDCEVGDAICCISDYNAAYQTSDFCVIQGNLKYITEQDINNLFDGEPLDSTKKVLNQEGLAHFLDKIETYVQNSKVINSVDDAASNGINLSLDEGELDIVVTPGTVSSGNESVVTGGDVYNAIVDSKAIIVNIDSQGVADKDSIEVMELLVSGKQVYAKYGQRYYSVTAYFNQVNKPPRISYIVSGFTKYNYLNGELQSTGNPYFNILVHTGTQVEGGPLYLAQLNSPELTGTPTAPTPVQSDKSTRIATTEFVKDAISDAQIDKSTFQGVINSNNTLVNLTEYKRGYHWVVRTAGIYAGHTCEVGDMIYCISNYNNSYNESDFTVLQNNIADINLKADKDINAVEGNVAVFDNVGNPVDSGLPLSIPYQYQYLTFEALESGTFNFLPFNNNETYYSTDGKNWTKGNSVNVSVGDKVMWKGEMTPLEQDHSGGIGTFGSGEDADPSVTTILFKAYGNVMSLLYGDNFINNNTLIGTYTFNCLFRKTNVTETHNLILPATTLVGRCYWKMFYQCSEMVSMPNLPATTLAENCYCMIVCNCTKLTDNIPSELPVTTLADYCYVNMFYGCTSLVVAPKLPATTLSLNCYASMFQGCSNLEVAPELPAPVLTNNCYWHMFDGCGKLNFIKCLATNKSASNCCASWVKNVASTGTFIKTNNTTWSAGVSGIPSGWQVYTEEEYELVRHYELTPEGIGALPDTTLYAGSQVQGGAATKAISIPTGQVDSTSTATAFTATVEGITELKNGVTVWLKNGVVKSSSSRWTLNINGLGAKYVVKSMQMSSNAGNTFDTNYAMLFVFDATQDAWMMNFGYYQDTNDTAYKLRAMNAGRVAYNNVKANILLLTKEGKLLAINETGGVNTSKTLTTESFDPFGGIWLYSNGNTPVSPNDNIPNGYLWNQQSAHDARNSFNITTNAFVDRMPVYLVAVPQSDGTAKLHTSPVTQTLPSTEDGFIYIEVGIATLGYQIDVYLNHPIYYFKDGAIRLWTNEDISGKQDAIPDLAAIRSGASAGSTALQPTDLADWAKQPNKPTYTASEVEALPATTPIPSKTSDLTNDVPFLTSQDAPSVPQSINAGDVTLDSSNWAPEDSTFVKRGAYLSSIHNALYSANSRWVVTHKVYNVSDDSYVKDASVDKFRQRYASDVAGAVASGQYGVLYIGTKPIEEVQTSGSSDSFLIYGQGYLIVEFYGSRIPLNDTITARVWIGNLNRWSSTLNFVRHGQSTYIATLSSSIVYPKAIEITYLGADYDSNPKGSAITEVEWYLRRPEVTRYAVVTKYGNKQDLWGEVEAPKFIKRGGTSSQFLKADGSVDSTAYATSAALTNLSANTLPSTTKYAGAQVQGGAANKAASIPFGVTDEASTNTAFLATVDGITELRDGVFCIIRNTKVSSISGFTLNVNNLGAKGLYKTNAASSRETYGFEKDKTYLLVYSASLDGWLEGKLTDENDNTQAYQVYDYSSVKTKTMQGRYMIMLSYDEEYVLPVCDYDGNTTTSKVLTTESFDVFGNVYFANLSYNVDAGAFAKNLYISFDTVNLRYAFNISSDLIARNKVYLVCVPQSDGKVKLHSNPLSQTLPTTEDGLVYKLLGHATSGYQICMYANKPCYYYKDGAIREWTNADIPTKTSELTNDSGFLVQQDISGKADSATTLAGYGITDAKIENGVITLGSNTITPLTAHQSLSNYVTLNSAQTITGEKTFTGTKRINFKQGTTTDKLGFTLYNNSSKEVGYLEWQPTGLNSKPTLVLGSWIDNSNGTTPGYLGFKVNNVPGAAYYMLMTPLASDAKTPLGLSSNVTTLYFPLQFKNGSSTVLTANTGVVDLSSLLSGYLTQAAFNTNNPDLAAIEALSGTSGILKKTAANTWELGSSAIGVTPVVNHGTSDTTFALTPNIYHKWGSVSSLTLTLATPDDVSVMNEYIFSFTSPATPTTLSIPASVNWVTPLDIEPSKEYRVSIIDNLATWITSDMVVPIGDVNTPEFATKAYVDAGLALKEDSSNKVTSVDENSTDTQYPSAKAMYDALNPE